MTCEDLRPDYTSFALGIAGEPERSEIAAHLERNCLNCVPGVASAMTTVTALSGAVKVSDPPKNLRRRVIASVGKDPKRSNASVYFPWVLTGVMSIALLAIGLSGREEGVNRPMQQALSILNDPAARTVAFGQNGAAPHGRIFFSADKGVVFTGADLPRIDGSKTFELWVVPLNGNAIPAGLFRDQSDATALFVHPGSFPNAARITVTVEPADGSSQPTTAPVVTAAF